MLFRSEYSLVTVRRSRIEQLASQGSLSAALVRRLLDQTDRILAASQLGITMSTLIIGWIAEETVARILFALAHRLNLTVEGALIHTVAFFFAFLLVTSLHIVLGEQAPKIFSIRRAEMMAMLTARPMIWFERTFRPLSWKIGRASCRERV